MPRHQKSFKNIKIIFIIIIIILAYLKFIPTSKLVTETSNQQNNKETNLNLPTIKAVINGQTLTLEKAVTAKQKEIGLMDRKFLKQFNGMLFEFEQEQILSFWMKNTYIPLDIIFINSNNQITNIIKNAEPCIKKDPLQQNCPRYQSSTKANKVIEINGGETELLNIKPSQFIIFQE